MTAPATMTDHPSDQTLASFADGQLGSDERGRVVSHLSMCGECLSIVQYAWELDAEHSSVRRFTPRVLVPVVAIAAAIVIAIAALPAVREWIAVKRTGGMSMVVEAYDVLDERSVQPRLSGGFPHKPLRRTYRNAGPESTDDPKQWPLLAAESEIEARKSKGWKELRALGAAQLLVGDRDAAIRTLEQANALSGNAEPAVINDLAAAYLERARFRGEPADKARGLSLAERAWQLAQTRESAWNRALAYERNDRRADAVQAWQKYLEIDSTSAWAAEARERLASLEDDTGLP